MPNTKVLLSITNLKQFFPLKKSSVFSKEQLYVRANEDISLDIHQGETVGLVGESGCGKSTFGRTILELYTQTAGTTMYYGRSVEEIAPKYVEDTLKNAGKYVTKYIHAAKRAEDLQSECDKAGDKATYAMHTEANAAADAAAKALADSSKVLGGFMALDNVEEGADALLKEYHIGAKLSDINEKLRDQETEEDVLSEELRSAENSKKSGIESRLAKVRSELSALREKAAAATRERDAAHAEVMRLVDAHRGEPEFDKYEAMRDWGLDLSRLTYNEMRPLRSDLQIIFQDPYSSLNPRMTVGQIIEEGLVTHKYFKPGSEKMKEHILKTMNDCGLQDYMLHRYPHQFSGGQRQRICIARALAVKPKFVVCDEAVSALDVSIQSQIINLLQELKEKEGLTYLFISHDLSVVKYISDRIGVMYLGNLVELTTSEETFSDPRHPYTVALLSSIPTTEVGDKKERIILQGSIPSPINPPSGCKFHTRCFMATEKCSRVPPKLTEVEPGHFVACHYPERKLDENGDYLFKVNKNGDLEETEKENA